MEELVSNLFLYEKQIFFLFSCKFYEITCTFFFISDYKSQDCRYLCIIPTMSDDNNRKLWFHLIFPLYS